MILFIPLENLNSIVLRSCSDLHSSALLLTAIIKRDSVLHLLSLRLLDSEGLLGGVVFLTFVCPDARISAYVFMLDDFFVCPDEGCRVLAEEIRIPDKNALRKTKIQRIVECSFRLD
jgi:hypothetical protein